MILRRKLQLMIPRRRFCKMGCYDCVLSCMIYARHESFQHIPLHTLCKVQRASLPISQ